MKTEKIFDKQLRAASKNVRNAMLKALPDIEKNNISFSPEFEDRMLPLFRKNELKKRNKVRMRNLAAVLVLIFIGTSIWFLANKEAVAGLVKWTLRTWGNNIEINYYAAPTDEELPEFTFGWLPDGYKEGEKIIENPPTIFTKIEGKVGTDICLQYQFIREGTDLSVFGEELKTETVMINKQKALFFYEEEPNTANVLTWPDGNIYFMINSKLPKDVLIKIAENVVRK